MGTITQLADVEKGWRITTLWADRGLMTIPNPDRFGTELLFVYLSNAFPGFEQLPTMEVKHQEVQEFLWEYAQMVSPEAKRLGNRWSPAGIEEVDELLMHIAETGATTAAFLLEAEGIEEMRRRIEYGIIGVGLEELTEPIFHVPMPRDASPEVRGVALFLYVLGGPARKYPPEMFI